MLIDTHTHVVAEDLDRYPLSPGYEASWYHEIPVSADRLLTLMEPAEVGKAMLVQGFGPYGYDNSYAVDAAREHPGMFSSVVVVDFEDDPLDKLDYWVKERGARGVRLMMGRDEGSAWLDLWQRAVDTQTPVCVQIMMDNIPRLREALKRFGETPIALDHCGFPDLSGGPPYEKAKPFFELSDQPNVHLKVSSINLQRAAKAGDARDFVKQLVATYGADRLMWGSDYSQTNNLTYEEFADLARYATGGLSRSEQRWFHEDTSLKLWPELA